MTGGQQAPRLAVTGVSGQVGRAVLARARAAGFDPLGLTRADLDLGDPDGIAGRLDALRPDLIINPAAYTAVDRAESEPELAFRVNAEAPGRLAQWCARENVPLIHLSTDYVFSGEATRPYREDDPLAPVSVYGASKAGGERRVLASGAAAVIVRTAWVYDAEGRNFVTTMLRLGAGRDTLGVVDDQRGCPTAAPSLACGLLSIARQVWDAREDEAALAPLLGPVHLTDAGETTWYHFAQAIFEAMAPAWGRRPRVSPLTTAQYPTPARRPAWSVLDLERARARFGLVPPSWRESLGAVLASCVHPAGSGGGDAL
ncbi:dTDP-4-dehydrorhamnose reductase [Pararhodospirillum oryzae]|uniref:dTDP-4-dehydrorhamnose reductase n=1 Tax=Pararhodospirillum oryzae TaxID=478448 RepID=A0A512H9B3_9PROT|nr:dTDP-4-dehydrorhamnose reductase [Pararhodospirillum oryzae]GEO82046.1 NAD(P)-dependent oxidoreductase [Pararhodospirillum oryzae]